MKIELIDFTLARPLRARILRPGRPFIESDYEYDLNASTFHVGALLDSRLLGVATFYPEEFAPFREKKSYRLRGMAVDSDCQGKGVGKKIIQFAENHLKNKTELIWFNARENAFLFYLSLSYEFHGPMFEIANIGPHKIMYKIL